MKIKELRDYLNNLPEDVMNYNAFIGDIYDESDEKFRELEIEVYENDYFVKQTDEEIRKCKGLYFYVTEFELSKNETICIKSED